MVGRLSERRRDELMALLLGLVERRPADVADVLQDWAGDGPAGDFELLEDDLDEFIHRYHDVPLAELDLGQMLTDLATLLREHRLRLPSDLSLLIKAFISLDGIGRALDPGFHLADEALPLLRRIERDRYKPKALLRRGSQLMRSALALAEQLPRDASRLLRNARRGRVQVGIELAHLKRVGNQIDRAANRLAMALVLAALIVGSSIVMTVRGGPELFGLPALGLLGFLCAVAGGVWLAVAIWRSGRDDGRD
jgi:ubiquinone biosynthesis protein